MVGANATGTIGAAGASGHAGTGGQGGNGGYAQAVTWLACTSSAGRASVCSFAQR
jgi:hypothetical protein